MFSDTSAASLSGLVISSTARSVSLDRKPVNHASVEALTQGEIIRPRFDPEVCSARLDWPVKVAASPFARAIVVADSSTATLRSWPPGTVPSSVPSARCSCTADSGGADSESTTTEPPSSPPVSAGQTRVAEVAPATACGGVGAVVPSCCPSRTVPRMSTAPSSGTAKRNARISSPPRHR